MVMWGIGGVGKSALTIRYVTNNFLEEYDPTIEDSYWFTMNVEYMEFDFDILDTAGREVWEDPFPRYWVRDMDAIIIVQRISLTVLN